MCAIERAVMEAYDKTSIQINRCKRILALVDTYVETETASARTDLRKALMEEFEAPAIAPPVAAGSVDIDDNQFRELYERFNAIPGNGEDARRAWVAIVEHVNSWGAQQHEAGWVDGRRDQYQAAIEQRNRAEKAEARVEKLLKRLKTLEDYDRKKTE